MFQFFSNRFLDKPSLSTYFCTRPVSKPSNFVKPRSVICSSTTSSRDSFSTLAQLRVNVINITLQTSEEVVKLQKMIDGVTSKEGKYGSGLLGYVGTFNPAGSVFLGTNTTLNKYIVRFLKEDGFKIFEELRNANVFKENTFSTIEGYFECSPPEDMQDIAKLQSLFEITRNNQQKKRKSVTIKNEVLEIGSKESGSLLSIKKVTKTNNVLALQVEFCFKQNYAKNCGLAIQANDAVSIKDVIAYTIVDSLKLVTSSELLLYITTTLQRNFSVSQIIAIKTTKRLSKSGVYVTRSLSGVFNKLKEASTAIETETIFLEWFETKLSTLSPNTKDQTQIVLKIGKIIEKLQPTLAKASRKSTTS